MLDSADSALGPRLICVGMPKCGTSTLHDMLMDVDEFFVPPVKEIKFFAYADHGYEGRFTELLRSQHWMAVQDRRALAGRVRDILRGRRLASAPWLVRFVTGPRDERWYQSLFPADRVGVDISPVYHQLRPARIADVRRLAPQARILILLRDPLEQLWSHTRMVVTRKGGVTDVVAFRAHLARQLSERESYGGLVADWEAAFPGAVLVANMREMIRSPADFIARLRAFCGLDPAAIDTATSIAHVNAGISVDFPDALRVDLVEAARRRLEGFETVDPVLAAEWRQSLTDFANARAVDFASQRAAA